MATSTSSSCYFCCQKAVSTNQISECCHMTTLDSLYHAVKRHSHAHSCSTAIARGSGSETTWRSGYILVVAAKVGEVIVTP